MKTALRKIFSLKRFQSSTKLLQYFQRVRKIKLNFLLSIIFKHTSIFKSTHFVLTFDSRVNLLGQTLDFFFVKRLLRARVVLREYAIRKKYIKRYLDLHKACSKLRNFLLYTNFFC